MKKLLIAVFAGALMWSMSALAQDQSTSSTDSSKQASQASSSDQSSQSSMDKQDTKESKKEEKAEKKEAKAAEKGKSMSLTGWVKTEGDKTTFVNDKDKQSWTVSNPDKLQGEDGKHVKISAKLNEADHSLTVEKMKEMKASKQSGETQKQEAKQ